LARDQELIAALDRLGHASGPDLARVLGVSPATLSRAVRTAGDAVCRMGRTRGARYSLRRRIADLPPRIPVFRVDRDGRPARLGDLSPLRDGGHWLEFTDGTGRLFEGTPPFVFDMQPQGYLGAGFAGRHPELGLPQRLSDWNDDHRLIALAQRGEDCVGNLVIGETAFERFQAARQSGPAPVPDADYPAHADVALERPAGSSAGGEHPKFAAFGATADARVLVKFPPESTEAAVERWRDLLVCEALALDTLRDHRMDVAVTRVVDVGDRRFLESVRFDRVGVFGRIGVVSLAAIDAEYVGVGSDWTRAAEALQRDRRLGADDRDRVRFADLFGRLIGNTDRHLGNLSFYCSDPSAYGAGLRLAPIYDMLPMMFAPAGGRLPATTFDPGPPRAADLEIWPAALRAATDFWQRTVTDARITDGFRALAKDALDRLRSLARL
jgi:hypothetical protein